MRRLFAWLLVLALAMGIALPAQAAPAEASPAQAAPAESAAPVEKKALDPAAMALLLAAKTPADVDMAFKAQLRMTDGAMTIEMPMEGMAQVRGEEMLFSFGLKGLISEEFKMALKQGKLFLQAGSEPWEMVGDLGAMRQELGLPKEAPAQATEPTAQATETPAQATETPAQVKEAPAQATSAPAQPLPAALGQAAAMLNPSELLSRLAKEVRLGEVRQVGEATLQDVVLTFDFQQILAFVAELAGEELDAAALLSEELPTFEEISAVITIDTKINQVVAQKVTVAAVRDVEEMPFRVEVVLDATFTPNATPIVWPTDLLQAEAQPKADEMKAEDPKAEDPKADKSKVEEPKVELPKVG